MTRYLFRVQCYVLCVYLLRSWLRHQVDVSAPQQWTAPLQERLHIYFALLNTNGRHSYTEISNVIIHIHTESENVTLYINNHFAYKHFILIYAFEAFIQSHLYYFLLVCVFSKSHTNNLCTANTV